LLLAGSLGITFACHAQETSPNRPTAQEEVEMLQHLTYLRVMQDKCPFSKSTADQFGFVSMVVGMQMSKVSESQLDGIMRESQVRADKDVAASKNAACGRAEKAVGMMGEAIGNSVSKQSTE
jgi:hypothetical protein